MPERNDNDRIVLLITILERSKGKILMRFLDRYKIGSHLECTGIGTATSEMLDVLGLGSRDKDIIVSLGTNKAVTTMTRAIDSGLWEIGRGRGLMMQLSPTAVNNLIAAVLIHNAEEITESESKGEMKNEYDHSLILIAVKQGFTDKVMQTARKAGATGGTVIRSRMTGVEQYEENFGIHIDAEKEIIAILAPDSQRDNILEAVNTAYGLRSPAQTILCALPVDKAFKF